MYKYCQTLPTKDEQQTTTYKWEKENDAQLVLYKGHKNTLGSWTGKKACSTKLRKINGHNAQE